MDSWFKKMRGGEGVKRIKVKGLRRFKQDSND